MLAQLVRLSETKALISASVAILLAIISAESGNAHFRMIFALLYDFVFSLPSVIFLNVAMPLTMSVAQYASYGELLIRKSSKVLGI